MKISVICLKNKSKYFQFSYEIQSNSFNNRDIEIVEQGSVYRVIFRNTLLKL